MSLPTTAPAASASRSTDARQVSTESGTSKRALERLDGGDHPLELLGLGDLGTGPGLHPADVEEVGALVDELLGLGEEAVEVEVRPWSKNESGVRLRMPITSARWRTSKRWGPRATVGHGTCHTTVHGKGSTGAEPTAALRERRHGPLGRASTTSRPGTDTMRDRQRAEVDRRGAVGEHVRSRPPGAHRCTSSTTDAGTDAVGDDQQVDRADA